MPAVYARALGSSSLDTELVDATGLVNAVLVEKSEYDQEMVRRSASIGDAVMWEALRTCGEGVPEYEVGVAAERVAAARGAEWGSGTTTRTHIYVASGSQIKCNLRPYKYTARRFESGEMFFIDLSVCYRGYYTDFCRTVVIGEPSDEQRRLFDAVVANWNDMKNGLKPGMSGDDVHKLAMESVDRHVPEYRDYVSFAWFGHGTGLIISEPPFFTAGEQRTIQSNMFVNIEPGFYVPGVGTTSLEDMLFMSEGGIEEVTRCPRELYVAPVSQA
jgi:Xaa-Pro aminopeptidase